MRSLTISFLFCGTGSSTTLFDYTLRGTHKGIIWTDASGIAPGAVGPLRTSQQSTSMELCDGLQWFALQGETLAAAAPEAYVVEHTFPILGEVEFHGELVREAVSLTSKEMSSYSQKLTTAALAVFSQRLTDCDLRDQILTFFPPAGRNGSSSPRRDLSCVNQWRLEPFPGLISDPSLGRTNTFLLHLEGLFRLAKNGTHSYSSSVSTSRTSLTS